MIDLGAKPAKRKHQRTPEQIAARKAKYLDRKLRQVCCDCEAELEEDDGVRCARCASIAADGKRIYVRSPGNRMRATRAVRRRRRLRRRLGLCERCPNPGNGSLLCVSCRAEQTAAQAGYRARRAAGTVVSRAEQRRRRDEEYARLKGIGEKVPLLDRAELPQAKILRALRWFDWVESRDLYEAIGVADHERNVYDVTLSRIARTTNLIERRATDRGRAFDYRLSSAGREVVQAERKRAA